MADERNEIVEPGISCGRDAGWSRIEDLIEQARRAEIADSAVWSVERRERIFARTLAKANRERERGRLARAYVAGACTVLLAGLLLRLISVGAHVLVHRVPEGAGKVAAQRLATE
jgi:hypothetical protein